MIASVDDFHDGEIEQHRGAKKLQLPRNLTTFPLSILELAPTLEHLDLSNNPLLSTLPNEFSQLINLKIAFFSNCAFTTFPPVLSQCPSLEMVAFKSNGMTTIPEDAFPPKLRWLILTNNKITKLPQSIGKCTNLTKCMLAGNALTELPESMKSCKKLTLLRLARNNITNLPSWLFQMPHLSYLGFAGNPCSPAPASEPLASIPWTDLQVGALLGEGASGVISKGHWVNGGDEKVVAVKVFKGDLTSDGAPEDEMNATIAAGAHPNLVSPLGNIISAPSPSGGLVLELIPPHYDNLGGPPTLQSCVRDSFPEGTIMSVRKVLSILKGVASASQHLHARGIMHGDLYAHNILNDPTGHALLGDFGAASVYQGMEQETAMEALEIRAFGHLIEDMISILPFDAAMVGEKEWAAVQELSSLASDCTHHLVGERPLFGEICQVLNGL